MGKIEKQKANAANQYREPSDKKLSEGKNGHADKTATKAAELFNTNRNYVNQARKIKESAPEIAELFRQDCRRVGRVLLGVTGCFE